MKKYLVKDEGFLTLNNILSDCQYVFRSGMSTTHAALELFESISSAIDNKQVCAGIFIDLKKAFDTVDHALLVKKLNVYGVRGLSNSWLSNYFTNIKQYVYVDGHSSNLLDVSCGVPQGSVLGPILFLIYINDICNVSDSLQYVLFADDINIFCSEKKLVDLQVILNLEVSKLYVWFSVNKLPLNLDKTNYILFRNRPPDNSINLHINNGNVPQLQSTKFVGIIIDEQINWKPQILAVR